MPAVISTPVTTWVAALTGGAFAQSANFSFTFHITAGWEARIAIQTLQPNTSALSAGPEIYIYRSTDGGATYGTVPIAGLGVTRSQAANDISHIRLETGQYAIRILSGGGAASTWSCAFLTSDVITAIQNN